MGLQSGIIVNEKDKRTILVQTIAKDSNSNPYPNRWDEYIPGMIHYCATRKGVLSSVKTINLESKLNKCVNLNIYPIYIFVRYPEKYFRFMGEFVRLPKYDEKIVDKDGKEIFIFSLISKNIDLVMPYINEIKNMMQ
jgi:hypothetical protein